ncbi:hypothetical protein FAEPRAM212_03241 [Faecalibacterium prausnitzii M21/2]|uniref:Uncharacterized protein n=1 Tax=Faecalibacterium prausnitzii M21/2 TaxID=411485 RepID=A8SH34_9FIRM|nr:hypothetical protein FAEPRAM212_03241 [Faecalibacterium prausnitzii M21/2]
MNALRVALRINSGKIIFISQFWKICGFSRIAFSREGSFSVTLPYKMAKRPSENVNIG